VAAKTLCGCASPNCTVLARTLSKINEKGNEQFVTMIALSQAEHATGTYNLSAEE
jgi:hypothetical protein